MCRISVGSVGYVGYFTIFQKLGGQNEKKKCCKKFYYEYFSVFPTYPTLPSFPTQSDEKLICKRGRDFCVRHWKIETDKIPHKGQHISSNSINNKMEEISKDTMWFIVNEQRITFLERFRDEVSDWIQDRLDEQDWATLERICQLKDENWEYIITMLYEVSEAEGEEKTFRMYNNLKIQYRDDRMRICKWCIFRVKETIAPNDFIKYLEG